MLGVIPTLPRTLRYRITLDLSRAGAALAQSMGSQGVSGIIAHENPEFQGSAERQGWARALDGVLYYKSIDTHTEG